MGEGRSVNEDRFWLSMEGAVCAVLDGCGAGGALADAALGGIDTCLAQDKPETLEDLVALVNRVNASLVDACQKNTTLHGSGTTIDLLMVRGNQAFGVHVGDGRVYLFREGTVCQLSEDDRHVAQLVAQGQITAEQALTHPFRNVVTQVLGHVVGFTPQGFEVSLLPGDVLVACSDGVWKAVDPLEILAYINTLGPEQALERIITSASASNDNATLVIGIVD